MRNINKWWLASIIMLVGLCILAANEMTNAQVTTGNILGYVTDPSNAAVPGAQVVVANVDTGYSRTVVTEQDGSYQALLLPRGGYKVTATKPGFQTFIQQGIMLSVNQNARLDIKLQLGEISATVNITEDANTVDTHSSQLTTDVQTKQLRELPVNGNRFLVLANTAPGVVPVSQGYGVNVNPLYNLLGSDVQAAGARSNQTDYQFDSSHYRMNTWGGSPNMPSSESIQEVKIVRNNFSAEYGLSSAIVINAATKNGTNELHGSFYDFLGNDAFNSRSFTAGPTKPKLRYNMFGATVGGPVRVPGYNGKDKTFFFFGYEGIRRPGETLVSGARPLTPAMQQGDFSALSTPIMDPMTGQPFPGNRIPSNRLSAFPKFVADKMPLANVEDQYRANFPTPSYENQYSIRIDQNLTDNSRLFGRFFWDHPVSEQAAGNLIIPGVYGIGKREIRNRDLSLNHVHTFNPNLINQFTFAYNRIAAVETQTDDYLYDVEAVGIKGWKSTNKTPLPGLSIGSYMSMNTYGLLVAQDKSYQFNNATTWIRGRHTWKWGFEYARWYALNEAKNEAPGGLSFDGSFTGDARADFMLGRGDVSRNVSLKTDLQSKNYGGFFQDDFKFSSRFTLSMGLRYRVNGPWTPQDGLGGLFIANQQSKVIPTAPIGLNYIGDAGVPDGFTFTDKNDFSPRFGVAWDPTGSGKTSIRVGYGVYYDLMPSQVYLSGPTIAPYGLSFQRLKTDTGDPWAGITNPFPYKFDPNNVTFNLPVNASALDPHNRSPYTQSWTLTAQHQLHQMVLEGSYIGRQGKKLQSIIPFNFAEFVPGNGPDGNPLSTVANIQQRRPYHPDLFGRITTYANMGNSTYHALQLSTRGNLTKNLLATGAWTWGHYIDDGSNVRGVDSAYLGNPYNRQLDKANSDYDFRHIFTASLVWDLPQFNALPTVARGVLGGWVMSWMFNAQSGGWSTVVAGRDQSLSGFGHDRADQILPNYVGARGDRGLEFLNWVNRDAYALPAIGTFGSSGRNNVRGPAAMRADLSVHKHFQLTEKVRLNFRMDGYNIFNHPVIGNCRFGDWGCGMNNSVADRQNLGSFWASQSGRTIQFNMALRY